MLELRIDRSDPALMHDQVAAQIRCAIADGEAGPGDRLPAAKDFAAVLGANTNTVLRAFRVLHDEGLVEFCRGQGVRVTGSPGRGILLTGARELLALARHHGYRCEELVEMIRTLS